MTLDATGYMTLDATKFKRRRQTEFMHGCISMLAAMG